MNWNQILEDAIVGKVVAALIDGGYRLHLSDQDGGGLFIYAATDERTTGFEYWVRLTPDNGVDVISDFTTNLEKTLKPVNDFVAAFV